MSISCVTYNHQNYIADALDSILNQKTNFNFEILLHDDASSDNTKMIVLKYVEKYPEIFNCIFQTENKFSKGIKPRLNYLYPIVRGRYVALCDGDDYWTDPYKLQKQVDFMEKENLVLSFHQGWLIDKNKQLLKSLLTMANINWNFKSLLSDWPMTSSIMFDASILTKEFYQIITITWSGDQMLMLLAADKGDCGMLNEYMCNHILHSKGLTESLNKREWILNRIKSLIFLDKLTKYRHHSDILSSLNNLYYHFARVHSLSFFEKIKYIVKAFINLIIYGSGDIRIFLFNCKLALINITH